MSSLDSHPDAVTNNRSLATRGLLQQFVCGSAVFLPFARIALGELTSSGMDAPSGQMLATVISAALLIGLGSGFPLQSWIRRSRGPAAAIRAGLGSTLLGGLLCAFGPVPWSLPVGSLLIGLGLFGEWTVSAELTRSSLSSSRQWRGMQLHSLAFFVGALVVTIAADYGHAMLLSAVAVIISLLCLGLLLAASLSQNDLQRLTTAASRIDQPSPVTESIDSSVTREEPPAAANAASADSDSACEAEECCGGGCEWTPMPVWLGGCLAFVGLYAAAAILPLLIASSDSSGVSLVIPGGLLGIMLFQGILPSTGYAILLAPCLVLGAVTFGLSPWLGTVWPATWMVLQGATAAAIYSGCSGLVGESFSDSCQGNSRTVVLMTGGMAAAAAGVATGTAAALISPSVAMVVNGAICLSGIFWLRQIPSPLVSQRREDELSKQEADELMAESVAAAGGPTP